MDVFLAGHIEDASRSFLQKLVKEGRVQVNGVVCKRPSRAVRPGDLVQAEVPPPPEAELGPEPISLDIAHEDGDLLVVNKPSGMVVHPAPGHYSGTLVHAVLHHCADFQSPGDDPLRPGIVHRLDRFTSGLMVVAKSHRAFESLSEQAKAHAFDRRYLALVRGEFEADQGRIDAAIGRSLSDRGRMAITDIRGRDAVTRFRVLERLGAASLVALDLETGRTHQIRVHLRFTGHPVLGDPIYGVTDYGKWGLAPRTRAALEGLEGQALHAEQLGFEHPATGERLHFTAPLPHDFQAALDALRG